MEFLFNIFTSDGSKIKYTPKTEFNSGVTKIYRYIVNNVLPKYKSRTDLKEKIEAIVKFNDDLKNADNIKAVSENAMKTLNIIKSDLIAYITENNKKSYGGRDNNGVQQFNPQIARVDTTQVYDKPAPSVIQQSISSQLVSNTLVDLNKQLDTIFINYFNERITTFEDIKLKNNISEKNTNIRPALLPDLVAELLRQVLKPNSSTDIKLTVYSIISWYLSHNKVRGITLPSYDEMLSIVSSVSDLHKHFIYDINSYLIPGSANWVKAVSA